MKIGILSDSHGRLRQVQEALQLLRDRGAEMVLHCGDIDDTSTVECFEGWNAHFVFGNCDYDREGLKRAMEEIKAICHEPFGAIEMADRKIAFVHGHESGLMRDLERHGGYDYLFYGHTHVAAEHQSGGTRVINPGALHRAAVKSLILLDLDNDEIERLTL